MKRSVLPLSLLMVFAWALIQPGAVLDFSASFFPLRRALTLLTGALALGWMTVSMVLAYRPLWIERQLGGLDKLLWVHKWVSIGAVLLVVVHWLVILSPRTLEAWGWVEPLVRPHRGGGGGNTLLRQARSMGEWAAWLLIVLGILSLLRRIPYAWFRRLHKGMPVAFLIAAYHSVMLLPNGQGGSLFGVLVIGLALVGSMIAVYSLAGLVGRTRRYRGQVASVACTASGIVELSVTPEPAWPGHRAGQFVLLTVDGADGAHPFTIVSDSRPGVPLRFAIKPLGDFTRALGGRVRLGDAVRLEGPYGGFDFGTAAEDQVWVAGGIGVAPFLARLESLAAAGGTKAPVHFFYAVKTPVEATFPEGLDDLCRRAGVMLHRRIEASEGRFAPAEIGRFVSPGCSVWFCGPAVWGRVLQRVLGTHFALPHARFHREIFAFR